ncbi:MAG: MlaD family protein [Chitinophagales bacterium]
MSKEIKVAVFVIAMIAVAIIGGKFLKGSSVFSTTNTYYAIFDDVLGLSSSDQILVNGYAVGIVGDFAPINEGENLGKIKVELIVDDGVNVPKNSNAVLFAVDLLGEMSVKLEYGDDPNFLIDGDVIMAKKEADMIGSLTQELTPLTDQLNVTLANFNQLFDFEQQNKQSLNFMIETLNETMSTYNELGKTLNQDLGGTMKTLNSLLSNLESTTAMLNENEENISGMLTNFNELSQDLNDLDLKGTLDNVNSALEGVNGVLAKTETTDNTLGAILNDRTLYDNFEKASVDLDLLLMDVRFNPARYVNISVFGKKDKTGPILSEDEAK